MSRTMGYKFPSVLRNSDEKRGVIEVKVGETMTKVDYITTKEDVLPEGYYLTPIEAIENGVETKTDKLQASKDNLTIKDIKRLTPEEIDARYSKAQMARVCKTLEIGNVSNLRKDDIIKRLKTKVG